MAYVYTLTVGVNPETEHATAAFNVGQKGAHVIQLQRRWDAYEGRAFGLWDRPLLGPLGIPDESFAAWHEAVNAFTEKVAAQVQDELLGGDEEGVI